MVTGLHPYFVLDLIAATGAAVVAVVAERLGASADIVAVLGAMLAAALAMLEARKRDRSLSNTVSVFLGSAAVGSVVPGIVFNTFYPELAARLTWHGWAGSGFVSGLVGWGLILSALTIFNRRRDALLESAANRFLPEPPRPATPPAAASTVIIPPSAAQAPADRSQPGNCAPGTEH